MKIPGPAAALVLLAACSAGPTPEPDLPLEPCPGYRGATSETPAFLEGPWECALAWARARRLPAVLYVTTEHCHPCRELEERSFPDPRVRDLLSSLVTVKADGFGPGGEKLRGPLRVGSYPTLIVFGPDGREIDRILGPLAPEPLAETISDYLRGQNTTEDLLRRAAASPGDLDLQLRAGTMLVQRGRGPEARPLLERVVAEDAPGSGPRWLRAAHLLATELRAAGQIPDAEALLEHLAVAAAGTPLQGEALLELARCRLAAGDPEGAARILRERYPLDLRDSMSWFRLGSFALKERVEEAWVLERLAEGAALHPRAGVLWKLSADLEHHRGNPDAARACMEKALEANPEEQAWRQLLDTWHRQQERAP
ncbi:MAG: tetratricopeptide repeat protein [Deltaproteobacteria bacterium]|nr:tetratricopeptide repeat protein [Deltaproteobacteria bacterium]